MQEDWSFFDKEVRAVLITLGAAACGDDSEEPSASEDPEGG